MLVIRNVLLLVAIFAAIFSKRIDEAVNGNGLLQKVVLTASVGIILVIWIPVCLEFL